MRSPLALLALALLIFAAPVFAQEETGPLSENDFIRLVNAKTPPEKLIEAIKTRGIAFQVSAELEVGLKGAKVKQEVIDALRAPATLEVLCDAPGAELTVDNEARGAIGPDGKASLSGLAPGTHIVKVRAAGRVPGNKDVFLKPGEAATLAFELMEAVSVVPGPLGSVVNVQAGTGEDAALNQLEFDRTPEKRIPRLRELLQQFDHSPLALTLLADLQDTTLSAGQFEASLAAGEELLRRDPRNFHARVRLARAYLGGRNLEPAFDVAGEVVKLVAEFRAMPAPEGRSPEMWESQRRQLLETALAGLEGLSYAMLVASAELGDPTRRGGLFERFVTTFPDSPYRGAAYVQLAYAAQQQGNAARAVEWGTKALELNPDEPAMLVLVPDILSESGQNLDTARKLSNHLLELLATSPDKIRPPGLDDAQWDTQKQLWEGVAHSALGQMLMSEETATAPAGMAKTREAVKEFRAASPLLQPDALLYARNQYRLGFALAKVGDLVPARDALTEVVAMNSPYSPPARDILAKVQQALAKRGR